MALLLQASHVYPVLEEKEKQNKCHSSCISAHFLLEKW